MGALPERVAEVVRPEEFGRIVGAVCAVGGVEVSLGAPTDIAEKERIVEGYLAEHEGGLLLINVRVVSSPAYRELSSDNLTFGSGVNPEEEPEEPAETNETDE